ncbi:MAG: hypothetical protein JNL80_06445 [Phycisphaerae bacterium]|jgi:hypothetical protein|nr:hypothetical protein [Phycisphaerae bacterium]
MNTRQIIVRLTLGCLGITAASALFLLFLPWGGAAGRFTLTALAATVTAALSLPFAGWAIRPETRWGGFAGIAFVCAELLHVIVALWGPMLFAPSSSVELVSSMLYLLIAAPFAIVGAREVERRPAAGWCALISTTLALVLLLVQAFAYRGIEGLDSVTSVLGPTGFVVLALGGGVALGLVESRIGGPSGSFLRRWPLVACVFAIAGAAFISLHISAASLSRAWPGHTIQLSTGLTFLIYAYAIGLANILLLPSFRGAGALVQWGSAAAALGAASTLAPWIIQGDESWATPFFASLIMLLSGSIAIAVLRRFNAEPDFAKESGPLDSIELTCPRCQRRQERALGDSACDACGLRFSIRVEEPRCRECGQLLLGIAGDRCPECGTPVATAAPG